MASITFHGAIVYSPTELHSLVRAFGTTINTMPEKTLLVFSEQGNVSGTLPRDEGDCDLVLADFTNAGVDLDKLGADLQSRGAYAFNESWSKRLNGIAAKGRALQKVA